MRPLSAEGIGRLRLAAGWGLCVAAFAGMTASVLIGARSAEIPGLAGRLLTTGALDATLLALAGILLLRGARSQAGAR